MSVHGRQGLVVDDMLLPLRRGGVPGVLVPDDQVAGPGRAEQVGFAVPVKIRDGNGAGLADVGVDLVPLPSAAVTGAADVFKPVETVAEAPARRGDVEVAVAVEVGQG